MKKWLKRILAGIGIVALAVLALIGYVAFDFWYQNNYKSLLQTLESADYKVQFVLLTDIAGFGDPAWYVYQLPIEADITKQMKTGHNKEGVLFWNYSEGGDHSDNSKIEIKKKKYLVFSRGGFYHSLYDIKSKRVLINDESPWNSFNSSKESKHKSGIKLTKEKFAEAMDNWVQKNLHSKIEKILNDAKI
ncbi:MAG: hypothetical protein OEZ51_15450 [Nitrospinota bacterium]|nr:hypothetical protein [Nitrospinota bacterium]